MSRLRIALIPCKIHGQGMPRPYMLPLGWVNTYNVRPASCSVLPGW